MKLLMDAARFESRTCIFELYAWHGNCLLDALGEAFSSIWMYRIHNIDSVKFGSDLNIGQFGMFRCQLSIFRWMPHIFAVIFRLFKLLLLWHTIFVDFTLRYLVILRQYTKQKKYSCIYLSYLRSLQLLQNLGKVDRTADEIFDDHLTNFNRQQNNATRLQKEFNNYIRCVRCKWQTQKPIESNCN